MFVYNAKISPLQNKIEITVHGKSKTKGNFKREEIQLFNTLMQINHKELVFFNPIIFDD